MILVPVTISEAKAFVANVHRHHGAPVSGLFAIAAADDDARQIRAICIVGRPVAQALQDGWTAEVTHPSRPRVDKTPLQAKLRWERGA